MGDFTPPYSEAPAIADTDREESWSRDLHRRYLGGVRFGWLLLSACSYAPGVATPEPDTSAIPDAFDVTGCPDTYVTAGQTSRYRVILAGRKAWEHSDDCTDDLPGATHLVALDTIEEVAAIQTVVDAAGGLDDNKAWVGGVQPRMQVAVGVGWLSVTGGPMITTAWDGNEPNDGGGTEDSGENFVGYERGRDGLIDFPSNDTYGGICECDGKPLDAAAAAAIDANRQ